MPKTCAEQLCSIGSGAVESAVKQIDRRLQISSQMEPGLHEPDVVIEMRILNGQLAFDFRKKGCSRCITPAFSSG